MNQEILQYQEEVIKTQSSQIKTLLRKCEELGFTLEQTAAERDEYFSWVYLCQHRLGADLQDVDSQISLLFEHVDLLNSPGHRMISFVTNKIIPPFLSRFFATISDLVLVVKNS